MAPFFVTLVVLLWVFLAVSSSSKGGSRQSTVVDVDIDVEVNDGDTSDD